MPAPQSPSQKVFVSLQLRLAVAFTLVFIPCAAMASYWLYVTLVRQTMRVVGADLVNSLEGAAKGIDGDELQALASGPLPLRADGYPDDARYWRQVQWLDQVHGLRPRATLYTYRPGAAPGEVVVITSGEALRSPPAGYRFLELRQVTPELAAIYRQGLVTTTLQVGTSPPAGCAYHTQDCAAQRPAAAWGMRILAFTPVKDAQGQTVAGLAIDFDASDIQAARVALIWQIVAIGLGFLAVMLVLISLTSALTARSARRLARAVQNLEQGREIGPLPTGGIFQDEISLLAGELVRRQGLEAALRDSEARFRMIADNSVDVIWTMTPQGRFTFVSPSVERQRGYTPQEILAQPVTQAMVSPEAGAQLVGHLARRVAALEAGDETARVAVDELEQNCKDGGTVMTEVASKLVTDANGRVTEIVGVTRDITLRTRLARAQRQAEEALRESEERFRRIFEMAPLGAAVVSLDFRFSRVNQAFCNMLGYSSEEMLQLTFPDVTHPDDREASRELVMRVLRDKTGQYSMTKRYLRKDGRVIWGQVWVRLMRNAAGEPLYFLPLIWDLTEQRAAEQRYQDIYDNAVEGIFQSLPSGSFRSVNPAMARIFGYASPAEMIERVGDDIAHRIHADPESRAKFRRSLETEGEVLEFEARNLRKDGSVIWTRTSARAVRDEAGAVLYYEGFLEEVTARKMAEEEIRRLNADLEQRVEARTAELREANVALTQALRVKSEFLAMMSHELRTPLSGMLGLAQLLAAQVYGPLNEDQTEALNKLQAAGGQLLELIADVLDFASAGDDSLSLEITNVPLDALLQGAVQAVGPAAQRKQLHLTVDRQAAVATVQADAHRLRQMLLHLLNNAVKFTPPGGALGVEVALADSVAGRELRLTVWDNGIGVPPADQERIFEPFVQLDMRLARSYGGSGLGLTVVRRLAELHGGRVTVESAGVPGQGSRFSIFLPWRDGQA